MLSHGHYASEEIQQKIEELARAREDLDLAWMQRREQLDQSLELQLFLRDCEQAEDWMGIREATLAGDSVDGDTVDALLKKHEDFNRAIKIQEDKIEGLKNFADQLVAQPHFSKDAIGEKRDEVLDRWARLKEAMIENRSKLGDVQTLQAFIRDADEMEIWINEKLQTAMDDSYKDPTNVQAKHQKHQAFEAELAVNAERLQSTVGNGQSKLYLYRIFSTC